MCYAQYRKGILQTVYAGFHCIKIHDRWVLIHFDSDLDQLLDTIKKSRFSQWHLLIITLEPLFSDPLGGITIMLDNRMVG